MILEQNKTGAYFDAQRHPDVRGTGWLTWPEGLTQYLIVVGDRKGAPEDECEELDVIARDKKEASLVARAALARDYECGVVVRIHVA